MAKVAAISDTVVVSATSLGVGVWQDDTNISSKDTGGVDIIIRSSSSSSSFSRVDPASQKITSTSSKTFDSSTSSLTTDAAANSSNNSAPSNFKQKKRVRPISPENTKDIRVSNSVSRAAQKSSSSVEIGDEAPDFELDDSFGVSTKLSDFRGNKVLLSFFRFAACPTTMCRLENMNKQYEMLKKGGIIIICIFNSLPSMICNFASETSGVIALCDRKKTAYKKYSVKESTKAILQYEKEVLVSNSKKYKPYFAPFKIMKKDFHLGGVRILPADFLINETGHIVDLFRSKDPYNSHMPFDRLEAFVPETRRCKCNRNDCWTIRCKENYKEQVQGEKDEIACRRTVTLDPAALPLS